MCSVSYRYKIFVLVKGGVSKVVKKLFKIELKGTSAAFRRV